MIPYTNQSRSLFFVYIRELTTLRSQLLWCVDIRSIVWRLGFKDGHWEPAPNFFEGLFRSSDSRSSVQLVCSDGSVHQLNISKAVLNNDHHRTQLNTG